MKILTAIAVVVGIAAFNASPVSAADTGSIGAVIQVAAPPTACLTISRNEILFAPTALTPVGARANETVDPQGVLLIASCSTGSQQLLVSATNAGLGRAGGIWTLGEVDCTQTPAQTNVFGAVADIERGSAVVQLQTKANLAVMLGAGTSVGVVHSVQMPCQGSTTGTGSASFAIDYLAVVS